MKKLTLSHYQNLYGEDLAVYSREEFLSEFGEDRPIELEKLLINQYKSEVMEALDNARGNGYDFMDLSAEDCANDLHDYDSSLEHVDPKLLLPSVKEWFSLKGIIK